MTMHLQYLSLDRMVISKTAKVSHSLVRKGHLSQGPRESCVYPNPYECHIAGGIARLGEPAAQYCIRSRRDRILSCCAQTLCCYALSSVVQRSRLPLSTGKGRDCLAESFKPPNDSGSHFSASLPSRGKCKRRQRRQAHAVNYNPTRPSSGNKQLSHFGVPDDDLIGVLRRIILIV